jgi:hypothetical protein
MKLHIVSFCCLISANLAMPQNRFNSGSRDNPVGGFRPLRTDDFRSNNNNFRFPPAGKIIVIWIAILGAFFGERYWPVQL